MLALGSLDQDGCAAIGRLRLEFPREAERSRLEQYDVTVGERHLEQLVPAPCVDDVAVALLLPRVPQVMGSVPPISEKDVLVLADQIHHVVGNRSDLV